MTTQPFFATSNHKLSNGKGKGVVMDADCNTPTATRYCNVALVNIIHFLFHPLTRACTPNILPFCES